MADPLSTLCVVHLTKLLDLSSIEGLKVNFVFYYCYIIALGLSLKIFVSTIIWLWIGYYSPHGISKTPFWPIFLIGQCSG